MTSIGRHIFHLDREARRPVLAKWVEKLPVGAVVEFRDRKRSEEQNDKMWPMLRELSAQVAVKGEYHSPEWWKNVFLVMLGRELEWGPAPGGMGFIPCITGSSQLTLKEFSDLLELIHKFGTENGVVFKESPDE